MKKSFLLLLLLLVICSPSYAYAEVDSSDIHSYLIYDKTYDTYLSTKNISTRSYPASITKIMTAMIVLDEIDDLNIEVTASSEAISHNRFGGSEIGIEPGEILTYRQLLEAMLVNSANEAAYIMAYNVFGNYNQFIEAMNKKAKLLNMTSTNFVNPCGLHDDSHYTSAKDILTMTLEALQYDVFKEIVRIKHLDMDKTNIHGEDSWSSEDNTNLLLVDPTYESDFFTPTGIKTGTTPFAGNCLVSSVLFNETNNEVISIVLGAQSEDRLYNFTKDILEETNNQFEKITCFDKNESFASINYNSKEILVTSPNPITLLAPSSFNKYNYTYETLLQEELTLPLSKSTSVGELKIYFKDNYIKSFPLFINDEISYLKEEADTDNAISEDIVKENNTEKISNKTKVDDKESKPDFIKILAIFFILISVLIIIGAVIREFKKSNHIK